MCTLTSLGCDIRWQLCRCKARLSTGDAAGALVDAEEAVRIAPKFPQVSLQFTCKLNSLSCYLYFMHSHVALL